MPKDAKSLILLGQPLSVKLGKKTLIYLNITKGSWDGDYHVWVPVVLVPDMKKQGQLTGVYSGL